MKRNQHIAKTVVAALLCWCALEAPFIHAASSTTPKPKPTCQGGKCEGYASSSCPSGQGTCYSTGNGNDVDCGKQCDNGVWRDCSLSEGSCVR